MGKDTQARKERWEWFRTHLSISRIFVKDDSGKHPGSILVGKDKRKTRRKIAKSSGLGLTNHQRCILLRAKRMGISIQEYQRRYPKT